MAEQIAAGLGPDVLALHTPQTAPDVPVDGGGRSSSGRDRVALLAPPKDRIVAEADQEYYRRKQSLVSVRQVSGHRVVAVLEVVSPGNQSTRSAFEQFTRNAAEFLDRRIHLLIIDLIPPGRFDPSGIHGAIWDEIAGQAYAPPVDRPLTVVAYESDLVTRADVEPVAVGDVLPDMRLFLEPGGCVRVPRERSYQTTGETPPAPLKPLIQGPAGPSLASQPVVVVVRTSLIPIRAPDGTPPPVLPERRPSPCRDRPVGPAGVGVAETGARGP